MEVDLEGCLDMLMICACCLYVYPKTHTYTHTHRPSSYYYGRRLVSLAHHGEETCHLIFYIMTNCSKIYSRYDVMIMLVSGIFEVCACVFKGIFANLSQSVLRDLWIHLEDQLAPYLDAMPVEATRTKW